jgi:hypothetical protein
VKKGYVARPWPAPSTPTVPTATKPRMPFVPSTAHSSKTPAPPTANAAITSADENPTARTAAAIPIVPQPSPPPLLMLDDSDVLAETPAPECPPSVPTPPPSSVPTPTLPLPQPSSLSDAPAMPAAQATVAQEPPAPSMTTEPAPTGPEDLPRQTKPTVAGGDGQRRRPAWVPVALAMTVLLAIVSLAAGLGPRCNSKTATPSAAASTPPSAATTPTPAQAQPEVAAAAPANNDAEPQEQPKQPEQPQPPPQPALLPKAEPSAPADVGAAKPAWHSLRQGPRASKPHETAGNTPPPPTPPQTRWSESPPRLATPPRLQPGQ